MKLTTQTDGGHVEVGTPGSSGAVSYNPSLPCCWLFVLNDDVIKIGITLL